MKEQLQVFCHQRSSEDFGKSSSTVSIQTDRTDYVKCLKRISQRFPWVSLEYQRTFQKPYDGLPRQSETLGMRHA